MSKRTIFKISQKEHSKIVDKIFRSIPKAEREQIKQEFNDCFRESNRKDALRKSKNCKKRSNQS